MHSRFRTFPGKQVKQVGFRLTEQNAAVQLKAMERHDWDTHWMKRALELARKGLGTTSPNPPVGAVIVKDGRIMGEGWHEKAGQAHAERRALADALQKGNGDALPGSTIYVTLEPCSSWGRTPPCTEAIVEANIHRVVYGAVDPDERHQGRADAFFRAHGIDVCRECCAEACRNLLRPWMWSVRHRRPWVLAKVACTLDGRMTREGNKWLSCEESVAYAHRLRWESDAILVGGNTVRQDDPALTIRKLMQDAPAPARQPWRIVLTQDHRHLPPDSKVLSDAYAGRTLVYERQAALPLFLERLYEEKGIVNLMLECGGSLLRTFLEEGLVNEWVQIWTPMLVGGGQYVVPGERLPEESSLLCEGIFPSGCDVIWRGVVRQKERARHGGES